MTGKKITVLGGGNGAHTMAAEFTLKGHTVNMYEMPLTNGFIDIINVVHGKDWRMEGCDTADLGIGGMDKEQLLKYVRTGER